MELNIHKPTVMKKTLVKKKGQMKIQQMAFMVLALFIFFVLVGIFFLNFKIKDLRGSINDLNREAAISSLEIIANMPELTCGRGRSLCLDEDKIQVMSGSFGEQYTTLWPVASIGVYKVYPAFDEIQQCPGVGCNFLEIYDNGQENTQEFSTYVSLCKKIRQEGYVYETCEIAKLVVGMEIINE